MMNGFGRGTLMKIEINMGKKTPSKITFFRYPDMYRSNYYYFLFFYEIYLHPVFEFQLVIVWTRNNVFNKINVNTGEGMPQSLNINKNYTPMKYRTTRYRYIRVIRVAMDILLNWPRAMNNTLIWRSREWYKYQLTIAQGRI